jgi:hypothetical protein
MSNRVNHPEYYKKKNGIETIEVIRHYVCDIANAQKYLMGAGDKPEQGMTREEKEIEDLHKAEWYIEDFRQALRGENGCKFAIHEVTDREYLRYIERATGHQLEKILAGYDKEVKRALGCVLGVGLIYEGKVCTTRLPTPMLRQAQYHIRRRILEIEEASKNDNNNN